MCCLWKIEVASAGVQGGVCHPEMGAELLAETGNALLAAGCPYSLGDKLQMLSCNEMLYILLKEELGA